MRPPRMRVALFGRSLAGISLANAMESAGHTVEMLHDPAELSSFQALILAVGEARLDAAVEIVEDHVHKGLIAMHTCLSRGCKASTRSRRTGVSWRQWRQWQAGAGQYPRWMSWAKVLPIS